MFGLFKKKNKLDILNDKYKKLLKESYDLSTINRVNSDSKFAEAEEVLNQIKALQKK
jgi:hypothetical protein